jgi:hypothetical protein
LNSAQPRRRNRIVWIALLVLVVILGLGSRRLAARLPAELATYPGDTLWALAVFLGLGLFLRTLATWWVALLALGISFVVELSQLYHAPWIDSIRDCAIGHLALGSGFDPRDLACYTVGVGIGVVIETLTMKRRASARSSA